MVFNANRSCYAKKNLCNIIYLLLENFENKIVQTVGSVIEINYAIFKATLLLIVKFRVLGISLNKCNLMKYSMTTTLVSALTRSSLLMIICTCHTVSVHIIVFRSLGDWALVLVFCVSKHRTQ